MLASTYANCGIIVSITNNPRGKSKARVFAKALGMTSADAYVLRQKLLDAARFHEANLGELDDSVSVIR